MDPVLTKKEKYLPFFKEESHCDIVDHYDPEQLQRSKEAMQMRINLTVTNSSGTGSG